MIRFLPAAVEPERWTLCFYRTAARPWMSWLACGEFKHVCAFAYLTGLRCWVWYDVQFGRTQLAVMPDTKEGRDVLNALIGDAVLVNMRRADTPRVARLGFFCTTAIAHLLGLRCVAARPDALYRHCLRHGGEVIDEKGEQRPGTAAAVSTAAA